jgi:serine/threonine protein kinase
MTLAPGVRFGPYEVLSALGVGGMGEVYRARDTRLERDVAIKVLPQAFASDRDRLMRFQREARVLASLNHPNIAVIYGIEDLSTSQALVMELVEGPTLADRIAQGPIAIAEALAIARQIADALASAHASGIVHRDLKPANIKLRPDGTVKLLDFGLAKAIEPPNSDSPDVDDSPTITATAMTRAGVILGTAAYMSPEQARGHRVDAQTDIWAFGCVLYEMFTGRSAFSRATVTDTLAAVIETEPDWVALPRTTPDSVVRLLRRTLEKNASRRLHAIADARLDLDEVHESAAAPPAVASSSRLRRSLLLAVAAAAVIVLLFGGSALWRLRGGDSTSTSTQTRTSITAPGQVGVQMSVAVSPDSRRLAYVSTDASGGSRIWIRDLNALAPTPLAGTEDAAHPFWSPDGSAIGFESGSKLKVVDVAGGNVRTLAEVTTRSGAAWSPTGVILFTPNPRELATVPATGGPVTTLLKSPDGGDWPSFLPDG